jgi:S-methylmethionine-dependent homocysteine/selenocysteine methylase
MRKRPAMYWHGVTCIDVNASKKLDTSIWTIKLTDNMLPGLSEHWTEFYAPGGQLCVKATYQQVEEKRKRDSRIRPNRSKKEYTQREVVCKNGTISTYRLKNRSLWRNWPYRATQIALGTWQRW